MTAPPILLPDSPEPGSEPGRQYIGWIALALMFALALANALYGSLSEDSTGRFIAYDAQLKSIVRVESAAKPGSLSSIPAFGDFDAKKDLADLEQKVAPYRNKDNMAQALYVAIRFEEHLPIQARDLSRLRVGKKDSTRALAEVYGSKQLTLAQAKALASRLTENGLFVTVLAKVHAFEKAGDKEMRKALIPGPSVAATIAVFLLLLGIFGGSVVVWFVFVVCRTNGYLIPAGLKNGGLSAVESDRFAARAAQLFAAFLLMGLVIDVAFGKALDSPLANIAETVLILGAVVLLFRTRVFGKTLTLADLGVTRDNLGTNILWGVCACVAELPVVMILGFIASQALKFLPAPEHPAAVELQMKHDPLTVLTVLLVGAVAAPIWEEIMFRGLLFPAMSRFVKGPVVSAILSSLIFASIHPQGIALWLALGTVAGVSCYLNYQTRSLVPSMVMHALHNATLMIIAVLIT